MQLGLYLLSGSFIKYHFFDNLSTFNYNDSHLTKEPIGCSCLKIRREPTGVDSGTQLLYGLHA